MYFTFDTRNAALAVKTKTAIKKAFGGELEFSLKNINVNGVKTGCSGFVKNPANGSIVYVDTEPSVCGNTVYCRYANDFGDYRGYRNHNLKNFDALVREAAEMLLIPVSESMDYNTRF